MKLLPFAVGDGQEVTEQEWRDMVSGWIVSGVIAGEYQEFNAEVATGMNVTVHPGAALLSGHYGYETVDTPIAVEAADATYDRIDLIVVRADLINRTGEVAIKTGTPAATPTAPTPDTTKNVIWEVPLWEVYVPAGATSLTASNLTDRRVYARPVPHGSTHGADGDDPVMIAPSQISAHKYNSATRTINIPAGSTAAEIQSILDDADHYIAPGETVILQFADGTYTIDQTINIRGWYGGGALIMQGNTSDKTAVVLDGSGLGNTPTVNIYSYVDTTISYMTIKCSDAGSYSSAVLIRSWSSHATIKICDLISSGTSVSRVVHAMFNNFVFLSSVTITGGSMGVAAIHGGKATCYYVHSGTTQPVTALWAYGGHIIKAYGTDITGSSADTYEASGGRVWT